MSWYQIERTERERWNTIRRHWNTNRTLCADAIHNRCQELDEDSAGVSNLQLQAEAFVRHRGRLVYPLATEINHLRQLYGLTVDQSKRLVNDLVRNMRRETREIEQDGKIVEEYVYPGMQTIFAVDTRRHYVEDAYSELVRIAYGDDMEVEEDEELDPNNFVFEFRRVGKQMAEYLGRRRDQRYGSGVSHWRQDILVAQEVGDFTMEEPMTLATEALGQFAQDVIQPPQHALRGFNFSRRRRP